MSAQVNSGTGPGVITPDGSPVEFYRRMRAGGEPGVVAAVVPAGGVILDLGAGTGRLAHALLEAGYKVVAVDESAEMLAHIEGAETITARIEGLRLDRLFDAVLLPSYLINVPDDVVRREFLATCRRHVREDGAVLVRWEPPEQYARWRVGKGRAWEDGAVMMTALERPGPELFRATLRYETGDLVWTQTFTQRRLTDEELEFQLAEAGLMLSGFLTADRGWIHAVPHP
ncbi:class I SAM-dependent methyltransferase [Sphaerisporangium siamense]|uniref:SAM-dependent methyltransferase n=1 Tax=Sphaerisporangium siamense TaxID=795645 RepID=A0A7W7D1T3_9ACTN|nr:class I SAM-dependent methyltransferase [Sphaerisporangium siamense]MBB4698744.1 SAM-dependent methyltransferase [Sphaerisporangium siamense]